MVLLVDCVVSFIQPEQPSERAMPMASLTGKKGGRRHWCSLTIGRAQIIIAVVGLYVGVFVAAFRCSVQARLYGYKTLVHGMAEDSASKQADEQVQAARTCLELARLIARDSRLDADRYAYACSAALAEKHPRLKAAWQQTLKLSDVERRDILQALEYAEKAFRQGAEASRRESAIQAQLKGKYEYATLYPWLPPEPVSSHAVP
jgi:hypothetical protein